MVRRQDDEYSVPLNAKQTAQCFGQVMKIIIYAQRSDRRMINVQHSFDHKAIG